MSTYLSRAVEQSVNTELHDNLNGPEADGPGKSNGRVDGHTSIEWMNIETRLLVQSNGAHSESDGTPGVENRWI